MEKIALLPGGFKPPHAGHYNMAKWLAKNTDADTVIVKVGVKIRDGINREVSLKLWNLYRSTDPDSISNKITVIASNSSSPVQDVYDFIENEAPEKSKIYLGIGEKDANDKRYDNIGKFAEPKEIEYEIKKVPPQAGGVSGTEMRNFIKKGDKENFLKYIPDHLSESNKEKAWELVSSISEDLYNPEDKVLDYMRSSEYKAGMPDGPKDDIPRAYKYKRGGMYTGGGMGFGGMYESKYYIDNSTIQGKGAFAMEDYPPGTIIDKLHDIPSGILNGENYKFYELGKMHNHSETPNCENLLHNNTRYLVVIKPIKQGEELTADYRLQPELEQPGFNFPILEKENLNECWDGYVKKGMKKKGNKMVPNCVPKNENINEADPKKGTGKKPKGSGRRLYTDEDPSDTVKVKFSTRQDVVDTLSKTSFKSKSHARKSQIINLIHQRVRAALGRTKDPQKKKSLRSAFEYIKKRKEASKRKTKKMKKEGVFTKNWWKEIIKEILTEGGAAGHMAHPFDLPNVTSGKDLKDIFEKAANSLNKNPGSVKIDGVNSSIRLVTLDGVKQFVMDRGSKKELDVKGITKDDLLNRFGEGHGMIKIGGEVLDMFNTALPQIESNLKILGAWEDPNILFNMEYVSGKTNVQEYGSNFIAIHGLNKIENKEVQGKRGPLTKRVSSEISYSKEALQSLLDNLKPIAKKQGFEVYGSVPTKMSKKPNFNSALSKNYSVEFTEEVKTQPLSKWLDEISAIPKDEFIFITRDNTSKKVGAVSKQVYQLILNGENVDDLFDENDKKKAIDGFVTYLATEKLGDEVLKVLDSPMGSVENHEGVVIRDEDIASVPFKITGKFILGGLTSDF